MLILALTQWCAWTTEVRGGDNWRTGSKCSGDNWYTVAIIDILDQLFVEAALDLGKVLAVELQ